MTALGYVSVVDKRPVRMLIFLNVALVLAVIAFSDGIGELIVRWSKQEEYSHGFLIPIISAWLLWTRREALYASIERASWLGLPLIFVALAMGIVGDLSAVYLLSQVGVVIVLLGIALCVGGAPLLRLCFIPIAFLLFAIPLPYFVDAILTLKLQLISSELGVFFIRLFGIPVYLDGNIIDMGTYKLQVVEACSGLRYLYPLLSLSFLAAYLFHAPLWQRTIVLLSSIPIAIGMNGFRIALVGILVNGWGNQMAEGVLHAFEGWVIFLACAMLLTAEMYVLALVSGKRFMDLFYFPRTFSQAEDKLRSHSIQVYPLLFAVGLLCVGTAFAYFTSQRTEAAQQRTPFAGFPDRLGDWRGRLGSLDNSTEQYLKLDDYILSDYAASDDKSVNLYVAYYASQRGGESPHSPVACIPGSGWAITDIRTMVYKDLDRDEPFNRVIIQKGMVKQIVYYWFDERGRKITNEWWAKYYLLLDAITMNRTDGALVRLATQVFPGETEAAADKRLQTFMKDALPTLAHFLPAGAIIKQAHHEPLGLQSLGVLRTLT